MTLPDRGVDLLLRRATDDLHPDVDQLVAGGIARGRTRQRSARIGTAVAAVAVFGVIAAGASAVPHLGPSGASPADTGFASESPSPSPTPTEVVSTPGTLGVAGVDIPASVDKILGTSLAAPALTQPPYGIDDGPRSKTASFLYDGMLTTVILEPLPEATAACATQPCPAATDGSVISRWGPDTGDGVTAQGVTVWRHGFGITAISYNAVEGKNSPALAPAPALNFEQLVQIAGSEVWFGSPGA